MKLAVSIIALLIAGFSGLISIQERIDPWRLNVDAKDEILYIPSGEYLKTAVLGYDNVVADLLWFRGIVLFGDSYRRSEDDAWFDFLERIVEVASDLDPLDHRIYLYGGSMLHLSPRHIPASTRVFLKGTENVSHYFMPFGVAMNALEYENDREKAVKYLQIAASRDEAPFYLRNLAATLLTESRQTETALIFLEEQLRYLSPGSLEYRAVTEKITDVTYQLHLERLIDARSRFQAAFGRDPRPLSEMVGVTLRSSSLPPDPFGGEWIVDPDSGQIVSSALPERLKEGAGEDAGHGGGHGDPHGEEAAFAPEGPAVEGPSPEGPAVGPSPEGPAPGPAAAPAPGGETP